MFGIRLSKVFAKCMNGYGFKGVVGLTLRQKEKPLKITAKANEKWKLPNEKALVFLNHYKNIANADMIESTAYTFRFHSAWAYVCIYTVGWIAGYEVVYAFFHFDPFS